MDEDFPLLQSPYQVANLHSHYNPAAVMIERPTYASIAKKYLNIVNADFSHLPDDLLIIILSFLPIKDAVKSSILSTRWRNLWKYVTNLNLTTPTVSGRCLDVETLFAAIQSSKVTKFQLNYQDPDCHWCKRERRICVWCLTSNFFDSVAKFSSDRCVEDLTFNFVDHHFIVPVPVFAVSTLVRLKLKNCSIGVIPFSANLPVLKTLVLIRGEFVTPVEELISKCPSLESLHLDGAIFPYSDTITINHLNLRSLIYSNSMYLELSTPALKWLQIKDCCSYHSGYVTFKNISSLVRCEFHSNKLPHWMYHVKALWRCLLKDLGCVKSIYLSEQIFLGLWRNARKYPRLQNTSLIFETTWIYSADVKATTRMLSYFPKLEHLGFIFKDIDDEEFALWDSLERSNEFINEEYILTNEKYYLLALWNSLKRSLSKMEKLKVVDIYGLIDQCHLYQMKPSAAKVKLVEIFLKDLPALETLRICVRRKTKSKDADVKYTFSNFMDSIKYFSRMTSTTIKLSILYS